MEQIVQRLSEEKDLLQSQLKQEQQDHNLLQEEHRKLINEQEQLQLEIVQIQQLYEELQDMYKMVETERDDLCSDIKDLGQKYHKASEDIAEMEAELDSAREVQDLAKHVEKLHKDLATKLIQNMNHQLQKQRDVEKNDDMCRLCVEKKREMVFIGCGHYAICENCTSSLEPRYSVNKNCPFCKKNSKLIKVFEP